MHDFVLRGKLPAEIVDGAREDVLTAAVIGAIADSPSSVRRAFLREVARVELGEDDRLRFELWPAQRLASGRSVEPDAWATGPRGALVIEAKAGSPLMVAQVRQEGEAGRRAARGAPALHLLTVTDDDRPPTSVADALAVTPSLFDTTAHTSWRGLHEFVSRWAADPSLEPGPRRLLQQAVGVLERLGRRPYRGMTMSDLAVLGPGLDALQRLATELTILNRRLQARLEPLGLHYNDAYKGVRMDGTSRGLDTPELWAPTQITLPYGAARGRRSEDYYFLRVMLRRPTQVWEGLSMRLRASIAEAPDDRLNDWAARLAGPGYRIAGVHAPAGQTLTILVEGLPPSVESFRIILQEPRATHLEMVHVFPHSALEGPTSADLLERNLLEVIEVCRGLAGLDAP